MSKIQQWMSEILVLLCDIHYILHLQNVLLYYKSGFEEFVYLYNTINM